MEDPQMLGFAELQICEQIHVCGVLGPSWDWEWKNISAVWALLEHNPDELRGSTRPGEVERWAQLGFDEIGAAHPVTRAAGVTVVHWSVDVWQERRRAAAALRAELEGRRGAVVMVVAVLVVAARGRRRVLTMMIHAVLLPWRKRVVESVQDDASVILGRPCVHARRRRL